MGQDFPRCLCHLLQFIEVYLRKFFMSLYPAPEESGFYGHADKLVYSIFEY